MLAGRRAGVALPLTGRYGPMALQSLHGLRTWADVQGVDLVVVDCGEDPADAAAAASELSGRVDILFGPYGSGATRAVERALAGREVVCWNHGGAATTLRDAWMVDVIGPAEGYWAGLAEVLASRGVPLDRVAILHAPTGFGRAVAAGAVASLAGAGAGPLHLGEATHETAEGAVREALAAGAVALVGCGRLEDDVAVGRLLAGTETAVALVVCGVAGAVDLLGSHITGWLGPCPWLADDADSSTLGPDADYPAAQAYAAGCVAAEAIAAAGSLEARPVWDAVRGLRTRTLLGPFAVDDAGRQVAHRPLLVEWTSGERGLRRRVVWRPEPA